jgi:hypothetical protein
VQCRDHDDGGGAVTAAIDIGVGHDVILSCPRMARPLGCESLP